MMENYKVYLENWIKGISSEYRYWDNYFRTPKESDIYRTRMDTSPEFTDPSLLDGSEEKILDVGSGPISLLGNHYLGKKLGLIAVDPLASLYNMILKKYKINPYCKTQFAIAELLSDFFEENSFDLVHMRNALDHTFVPINVVEQMLFITKLNKRVVLFHRINEAERREYGGFHQWNISMKNGSLYFWNKHEELNVSERLSNFSTIDILETKDGDYDSLKVIITKKKNIQKPATLAASFSDVIFSYFCKFTLEREALKKKLNT